jgi:uncharacterized membrane-anchored protein
MRRGSTVRHTLDVVLLQAFFCAVLYGQAPAQQATIDWKSGPITVPLGDSAEIDVPQGFLFTDKKGTQKLLELTQNIPNGSEVGALVPKIKDNKDIWFVTFEFHEVGFIRDDEKDKLDGREILKSLQDATEESNKVREKKGWPPFHVVGWEKQPFYDQQTNNLTWAILGSDDKGEDSVNHSIRVLGRHGTMNVDLVLSPTQYSKVLPQFNQLITGFRYREGHRYSDYASGDKLAGYGLTALIAGGAGALAVKTGFFMKLWRVIVAMLVAFWKALVALFIAIAAWIKRALRKLTSKRDESPSAMGGGE